MANLIFQTAFIGDALLCIPLIKQLRKHYPDSKPSIVCRPALVPFFEGLGLVEKAYGIDKKEAANWLELKRQLQDTTWENIICPHESYRSALFVRNLKAKNRVSYSKWWNKPFFNIRVNKNARLPEALRSLSLLAAISKEFALEFNTIENDSEYYSPVTQDSVLKWEKLIPHWADMSVSQDQSVIQKVVEKFEINEPAVFIAPGSVWPTKRWTISGYTSVAQELERKNYRIYLTGDTSDQAIADDIKKAIPNAINLCGKTTLLELHAMYSISKLVLSNDSSPIHMAAIAGAPVVAIFGPTTLGLGYRPWTNTSKIVQKNLSCRPCGKHGHLKCPIGTHACMREIQPSDVMSAISQLSI